MLPPLVDIRLNPCKPQSTCENPYPALDPNHSENPHMSPLTLFSQVSFGPAWEPFSVPSQRSHYIIDKHFHTHLVYVASSVLTSEAHFG